MKGPHLMLNLVIASALRNRLLVVCFASVILVWGAFVLQTLKIDVFPDLNRPVVTVMTESHGMAPEEVETRVTLPLEMSLSGMPGVERVRSSSGVGLSVIYVEFAWGTDVFRNRQIVSEKLSLARESLPEDILPVLAPISSIMGQIQILSLSSKDGTTSPTELRTLAEWVIRPRMLTIAGVAQVISIGGGLKQYQVLIDAEKLKRFQLSIEQVDRELRQLSRNTTGGFLEKDRQEYLIRNIGEVTSIEDIRNTVVGTHFGRPVLLSEIAEVKEGIRVKRGDGSFGGKPAVILSIQKSPDGDTLEITRQVKQAAQEIQAALPPDVVLNPDVFKQSNFIEASIDSILGKLKSGSVLVFLVLLVFLANLRMSLITLTAIPLSFVTTFLAFDFFGFTVNTMTLGGLAIAIGELVDDAIVDVENVHRRLVENEKLAKPLSRLKVIYEASSEVRNSIVLATVIIALVFFPLLNLGGLEGRFFTPLAFAYLTALGASLVVSLTVTPVLCSYLLRGKSLKEHQDTRFVTALKRWDRKVLEWALPRPKFVLSVVAGLLIASAALLPWMGKDFLPKFNEGTAMLSVIAPASASLTESNRLGSLAEQTILSVPEVKSVSRRTGRAELDEHAEPVNTSEIDVDFKDGGRPRPVVLGEIRQKLEAIGGLSINVGQPISHRIDHMMSGVPSQIAIKIFGPDLQLLRQTAQEIRALLTDVRGLVDLKVEQQALVPQIKIHVLREDAARVGLSAGEIVTQLESAFNGDSVGQVIESQRIVEVFFRFDDRSRESMEKIEDTLLKVMPDGRQIRVRDVADIYEAQGPNQINREGGQRRIVVSGNTADRDVVSVVEEIKARVEAGLKLPQDTYVVYGGQFESQKSASRKVFWFGLASLVAVFILLVVSMKSTWIAGQILITVPLAMIGGVLLLFLTDRTFSVASMVGFVTLCGIASRNSIMMISHYLHLMRYEGAKFSMEMVIRGSQERLVPVLMTASVATLALLPLVFAAGQPGSEILYPVAVVIVGGMLTSTLLDMIVTPVVFFNYGRKSAENAITRLNTPEVIL